MQCPRCKSKNIKIIEYMGVKCVVCLECDYDQREELDQVPEDRTNQKAKGRYSPYKSRV